MAVSCPTDLLGGRYRLLERIATGGMGVVWRAVDTALDRHVAIKLIRPEYADDPTFGDRLRSEARAIAAIDNPHVVRIFDVGEAPDPSGGVQSYLVMELVDGEPLSARLGDSGPLAPATVASIAEQAAAALAAAHAEGIVHRDVKSANLLLDETDRLTVVDFGIARAADGASLTATNTLLGSVHYLSPEQTEGQTATAASDVYALGVVAFRCLAGRLPFEGNGYIAVALAHREQPVPELPAGIPAGLAALVRQMLAKAPGDRPSAADVVARLAEDRASILDPAATEPAVAGVGLSLAPQPMATDVTGRIADRAARRRPLALAAAGGATAIAAILLVGISDRLGTDLGPAAPAPSAPAHSSRPSPGPTASARTPQSGHHIRTRKAAAPSHKPAPPTGKAKPTAPKQKPSSPAPKQKPSSPAAKQKPTSPAPKPTGSPTPSAATSPPSTGSPTPSASQTPPSPAPTPSTASPQPSPDRSSPGR